MKNIINEYIPFEHKNIDYINGSLNLARQQRQSGTIEGLMAAAVIYTNLVEYTAGNLLDNLRHMISLLSYRTFGGVFFAKKKDELKTKAPKMLGQLQQALKDYEFPDSPAFLSLLQKFSETRNAIFHRLLKLTKEELDGGVADKQFSELHNLAEEIIDKYNVITSGVATIWYRVFSPQGIGGQQVETKTSAMTDSELISQIKAQIAALQEQLVALEATKKKK